MIIPVLTQHYLVGKLHVLRAGRGELRTVLDFIGKGDVLSVTRVDRLARSIDDPQDIVRTLKAKGASLRGTEQPIDTSTAAGSFLEMLGGKVVNRRSLRLLADYPLKDPAERDHLSALRLSHGGKGCAVAARDRNPLSTMWKGRRAWHR